MITDNEKIKNFNAFKLINKQNKKGYYEKPNCNKCIHICNCNLGLNDCNRLTGWLNPCNQGCKYHNDINVCYIEKALRIVHGKNILECKRYEREK